MMDRIDRRTFLATGMKTGAALAAHGRGCRRRGRRRGAGGTASAAGAGSPRRGPPGPPAGLTTTGVTDPVGVDPDDVLFAWHVGDARRGAVQSGYRIVVTGPDGSASTVWDSGEVASGQQAFVGYGGPPLSADARYRWTVRTADQAGRWGEPGTPPPSRTGLRTGDWTASWLRPGPADPGQEEYSYLRTTRSLPAGTITRATAYVAAAHKYQLWVNGAQLDTGPELLLPRRAVLPGHRCHRGARRRARQRRRHPAPLVRAGPGPSRLGPGPPRPGRWCTTPTAGTSCSDRTAPGGPRRRSGSRPPSATTTSATSSSGSTARLAPTGWSQADFDDRGWSPRHRAGPGGHGAVHPPLRPADPDQRTPGGARCRSGPCPPARWWPTSGRSTPGGRPCPSSTERRDISSPCTWATPSTPTGPSRPPTTPRGPTCPTRTPSAREPRRSSPYCFLGFRYLQIDRPGRGPGRRPDRAHGPPRDHARRGRGHLLVVRADARCRVGHVCPLRPLHLPGAVHRHADPGEGPVPVGRSQRVRDGDADLR